MFYKMDRIYHGCMTKNADGTNRLIGPDEKCLVPTSQPFWKYVEDIPVTGVKTRRQSKNLSTVSNRTFDTYFRNKNKEDTERWMTAPDSEVYVMKPSDRFYVVWCFLLCFTVLGTMETY